MVERRALLGRCSWGPACRKGMSSAWFWLVQGTVWTRRVAGATLRLLAVYRRLVCEAASEAVATVALTSLTLR